MVWVLAEQGALPSFVVSTLQSLQLISVCVCVCVRDAVVGTESGGSREEWRHAFRHLATSSRECYVCVTAHVAKCGAHAKGRDGSCLVRAERGTV